MAHLFRYKSAHGTLQLVLTPTEAEWKLYATQPAQRGHLRTLLSRPVARMSINPTDAAIRRAARTGGVAAQLLAGQWELCLPTIRTVPIVVGALGTPIDSYQAMIGLTGPWDGHSRYRTWSISLDAGARAALDGDVSGEYELLEQCGSAMGSLHKRVKGGDGKECYLFLDPSRTGKEDEDHFVFAPSFERLPYRETREIYAELPADWRPWDTPTPGPQDQLRDANSATGGKALGTSKKSVVVLDRQLGKPRPSEEAVDTTVRVIASLISLIASLISLIASLIRCAGCGRQRLPSRSYPSTLRTRPSPRPPSPSCSMCPRRRLRRGQQRRDRRRSRSCVAPCRCSVTRFPNGPSASGA